MCVGFTTCAWKRSIIEVAADQRNSFLYLLHKSKLTTLCTYSLLINWSLDQIIKFYKVHSHILHTHTVIRNASYTLHLNQTQKNVRQWKAQNKRNCVRSRPWCVELYHPENIWLNPHSSFSKALWTMCHNTSFVISFSFVPLRRLIAWWLHWAKLKMNHIKSYHHVQSPAVSPLYEHHHTLYFRGEAGAVYRSMPAIWACIRFTLAAEGPSLSRTCTFVHFTHQFHNLFMSSQ